MKSHKFRKLAQPCETYLRAYADSDGPDQPAHPLNRNIGYHRMYQWRANAQNLCILHMFEDTFSTGAVLMVNGILSL